MPGFKTVHILEIVRNLFYMKISLVQEMYSKLRDWHYKSILYDIVLLVMTDPHPGVSVASYTSTTSP